jgi:hypothetical protein
MAYLTPEERRAGMQQLRRIAKGEAETLADRSPVAQDAGPVLEAIYALSIVGSKRNEDAYLRSVREFVTLGKSVEELRAETFSAIAAIQRALDVDYVLDNGRLGLEGKGPAASLLAPTLRWAHVGARGVRGLMDWESRVVVKAYTLTGIASDDEPADPNAFRADGDLFEIAFDLLVSASVLNGFVTDYDEVVTPHFVYQLDWFLGPRIASVSEREPAKLEPAFVAGTPNVPKHVKFEWETEGAPLVQYVVNEAMDKTLNEMLIVSRDSAALHDYEGAWNLLSLRAYLAQVLLAMDAAWDVAGLVHHDLHDKNTMVTFAAREPESPFTGKKLIYMRHDKHLAARRIFVIPPAEHANLIAQIIDFGRARCFARHPHWGADATPVLLGNPLLNEFGIFDDGARVDRSWDMRRLALDIINEVDLERLAAAVPANTSHVNTRTLVNMMKHALVYMAHLEHLALVCASGTAGTTSAVTKQFERIVAQKPRIFSAQTLAKYNPEALERLTVDRAVALYDAIQPLIAGSEGWKAVSPAVFNNNTWIALFGGLDAPQNGRHPTLSAASCLNTLPLFESLALSVDAEPTLVDAINLGQALAVGIVRSDMVDFDPQYGTPMGASYVSEGEAETTPSSEESPRPKSGTVVIVRTPRARRHVERRRAQDQAPEQKVKESETVASRVKRGRRMQDGTLVCDGCAAVARCETCGTVARGGFVEDPHGGAVLRAYCGPVCMAHALKMGRTGAF